jgi:hypothetical protein
MRIVVRNEDAGRVAEVEMQEFQVGEVTPKEVIRTAGEPGVLDSRLKAPRGDGASERVSPAPSAPVPAVTAQDRAAADAFVVERSVLALHGGTQHEFALEKERLAAAFALVRQAGGEQMRDLIAARIAAYCERENRYNNVALIIADTPALSPRRSVDGAGAPGASHSGAL